MTGNVASFEVWFLQNHAILRSLWNINFQTYVWSFGEYWYFKR